jgi:signal transduction histidine kinase
MMRQRIFRQTRTRILLLYALLLMLVAIASVPIFTLLFFKVVELRVQEDLATGAQEFRIAYADWKKSFAYDGNLKHFATETLNDIQPEDDNFLIVYVDNEYYKSNPRGLPNTWAKDSKIDRYWLSLNHPATGVTSDPAMGSIYYITEPLTGENRQGFFVAAHLLEDEKREALDGVSVFVVVTLGVVITSFILTWFASDRLLTPVRKLSAMARSIRESNLSQRLTISGSGELSELAETFNDMMDRLQRAFTSQRNFINDAGHELRTPITIIQGHLDLLQDISTEDTATIDIIRDELDRMNRLVNDMILLAKAERPDFLHLETIDIPSFTVELFTKMQALADRTWQSQTSGTGIMVGDRQRITGAILNLAHNAVKHTQPSDRIEFNVVINRQGVQFTIQDTGEGISDTDQTRIFERFARSSVRHRREGSGLGLTIVQAIAEAHGGQVTLTSQLNVGSAFTLILPLEPSRERA